MPRTPRALARPLAALLLATPLLTAPAPAQSPAFQAADVHPSPPAGIMRFSMGGEFRGDRFTMRNATLLDLIVSAYGVHPDNVLAGPSWLEYDRFDLTALTPKTTTPADIKLMLQSLLAARFHLVLHPSTKPMPAEVLTEGSGRPKIAPAAGSGQGSCEPIRPDKPPVLPTMAFTCRNISMTDFTAWLQHWSPMVNFVNLTGLKGTWDFDIHWNLVEQETPGAIGTYEAIDQQLGLRLAKGVVPFPVLIVDSVAEQPTPNAPDLAKLMPPIPPAQFEVATIKPSAPGTPYNGAINIDHIAFQGATLRRLVSFAWSLNDGMIVNAPKWFDTDAFDINGTVATDPNPGPNPVRLDTQDSQQMMRSLLADRFKMASHIEDHPFNAYTLIAVNPKLTKADPANRTRCDESRGTGSKTNPAHLRLLLCRNMTLAQFADLLSRGYGDPAITPPVIDATGLTGAYDLAVTYTPANFLSTSHNYTVADAPSSDSPAATDPSGGISFADALEKQLGLKIVKQIHPVPMLVIDRIDRTPTEN
jgi:uncharacterized protein (TIGR03435 family)